jgi:hypothetical protein
MKLVIVGLAPGVECLAGVGLRAVPASGGFVVGDAAVFFPAVRFTYQFRPQ